MSLIHRVGLDFSVPEIEKWQKNVPEVRHMAN